MRSCSWMMQVSGYFSNSLLYDLSSQGHCPLWPLWMSTWESLCVLSLSHLLFSLPWGKMSPVPACLFIPMWSWVSFVKTGHTAFIIFVDVQIQDLTNGDNPAPIHWYLYHSFISLYFLAWQVQFVLSFPCSSPGMFCFSKKLWFCLVEDTIFKNPWSGH